MSLNLHSLTEQKRLILVGGKGGVGKTTISAAIAISAANRGLRVLLVSTDPAHSLADALDRQVGDKPVHVVPNLTALEINPDTEIDAYLDRVLSQMRRYAGPDQINELQRHLRLSRQSPGAQEAALLERIAQIMKSGMEQFDLMVFDTAPTGHTLRLLSLPEVMAAWTDGLLKHNKRSRDLGSVLSHLTPGRSIDNIAGDPAKHETEQLDDKSQKLAETLVNRQRLFHQTRNLLSNPEKTAFLFVLTPERLPILETERAIKSLMDSDIPVAGAVVNRVLPEAIDNDFWSARRDRQDKHLDEIKSRLKNINKIYLELQPYDIQGTNALSALGDLLTQNIN